MSRYMFRHPIGSYRTILLLAAIVSCACTALTAPADERPDRLAGAGVAKAGAPQPASSPIEAEKSTKAHIQQLIRDLGSPHYTARRAAATELRQIGAEAFDLLDAATDNADPEVAASASYLLRQVPVRWAQADDHPLVRSQMRNYGQESEARRLRRVE